MEVLLKTPFMRRRVTYAVLMGAISFFIGLILAFGIYYRSEDDSIIASFLPDSVMDSSTPEAAAGQVGAASSSTRSAADQRTIGNAPAGQGVPSGMMPLPPRSATSQAGAVGSGAMQQPPSTRSASGQDMTARPATGADATSAEFVAQAQTGILVAADMRVSSARRATVGIVASGLTFILTLLSSVMFYRQLYAERDDLNDIERKAIVHHRSWLGRVVIGFTAGCIFMVLSWFAWTMFGMMFSNMWLAKISAVLITALYSAAIGFAVTYWVIALRSMDVVGLGLLTFALGLFGSFLLSSDPQWWQISLSYLGYDSGADSVFRISLVAVGLMLFIVSRDLLDTLWLEVESGHLSKRNHRIMAIGGLLICIGIAGVGIFPVRVSELSTNLHNASVYTAGATFGMGMLLIRWITPGLFHPFFHKISWSLLALCIVLALLEMIGIINFVALEIFAFAIFSVWLYLLNEYTLHHLNHIEIDGAVLQRHTQTLKAISV